MKLRVLMVSGLSLGLAHGASEHEERLQDAAIVLKEVMQAPDRAIPQELLDKAHCAVIVPGLKRGAFIFGARYGKGYVSCRKEGGVGWSAPGTVRIEGGSIGLQIGGSETDVILLVMNERGAERLMSSQFTLGGDASVAAGPVGRTTKAQTDALLSAQILSWSRSRGVFAGVSLQGATLRQDVSDNRELYGKTLENREIIEKHLPPPPAARELVSLLNKYSSRK